MMRNGNISAILNAKEEQKDLTKKSPFFVTSHTIISFAPTIMEYSYNLSKKTSTSSNSQSCNYLPNLGLQLLLSKTSKIFNLCCLPGIKQALIEAFVPQTSWTGNKSISLTHNDLQKDFTLLHLQ